MKGINMKTVSLTDSEYLLLIQALSNAANEFDNETNKQYELAKEARDLRNKIRNVFSR